MNILTRLFGRTYPRPALLEHAMRPQEPVPEQSSQPRGVWVPPPAVHQDLTGVVTFELEPTVVSTIQSSPFLRQMAHPERRQRLIDHMEAAMNGTAPRDAKGRFMKTESDQ